jgi:hypothetical protein
MSPRVSGVFTEINPPRLADPMLSFFKNYWDGKRGGRTMPARADIKPAEMKQYLPWVVMVDVQPGFTDFRYRMVGTRVTEYLAPQATGKLISEVFAAHGDTVQRAMLAPYRKSARDVVVVHAWGAADWLGRAFLDFETLYLPLSNDGLTANMVLAAIKFELAGPLKSQG